MQFQRWSLQCFYGGWLLVIAFIFKIAIFNTFIFQGLSPLKLILGGFVWVMGLVGSWMILQRATSRQQWAWWITSTLLLILLQGIFMRYFLVEPTWDFGTVFQEGLALQQGATQLTAYFYDWCPNNIGAAFLMKTIIQIGTWLKSPSPLTSVIVANLLAINLSLALLYRFVYLLKGREAMCWVSGLVLLLTPFYTYVPIAYTDTFAMIFPLLLFGGCLKLEKQTTFKGQLLWAIAIGVNASLGLFIKTNVLIMLVAVVIYFILQWTNWHAFKRYGGLLMVTLASTVLTQSFIISRVQPYLPIPYAEAGFPATHYLMMGATGRGGFNSEDFSFTVNLPNKEARLEATTAEWLRRLETYGGKGYLQFLAQKLHFTWSDGTFFAPEKLTRSPLTPNALHDYVYGERNALYLYLSQLSYLMVIIGGILHVIRALREKITPLEALTAILWFGVFLFLLFWETRSRYVLCFLPLLLLNAVDGWTWGLQRFKLKQK